MEAMEQVFTELTDAIRGMNIARTPPPAIFKGIGSIDDFFRNFEAYCETLYRDQYNSYLQVLPTFLEGEAKEIVRAFGTGANVAYNDVKDKLKTEFKKKTLGHSKYVEFFSAKRLPNESLVCFSIRLESMAKSIPNTADAQRNIMVKSKFLTSLKPAIAREVNIRYGTDANATLEQIVNLSSI